MTTQEKLSKKLEEMIEAGPFKSTILSEEIRSLFKQWFEERKEKTTIIYTAVRDDPVDGEWIDFDAHADTKERAEQNHKIKDKEFPHIAKELSVLRIAKFKVEEITDV